MIKLTALTLIIAAAADHGTWDHPQQAELPSHEWLVVDHAPAAIDEPRRQALRRALAARLPRKNGHATRNAKTGKSSVLSAASVRAMCASPHYGEEWGCFGYALPEVCRTPAREKGPGARNRTRARQSGKLDHIHGG